MDGNRDSQLINLCATMASSFDSWAKEFNEATKLAEEIEAMIAEKISSTSAGPDAQRSTSAVRRKITILGTRLDSLQLLLSNLPARQPISEKEKNKREDMISNLRSKVDEMTSTLNMSNANRENLLGEDAKPADLMTRTAGLDNHGLIGLQRQQDEGLDKLHDTVLSTKHIALAVNEELDLHTRLIDTLDEHVESVDSRLQRVQKRVAILNRRTRGACSCMSLLVSVMGIVFLAVVAWLLIRYL
ncbi:hypothetical protein C5167_001460 [Papaver somniferum]|uniref:t-SNARE coiled-coil homology domain-containing protein n=1 Tax=Papaver somniferum TaxID=3469 RepID=A0A4Y7KXZ0_PAPSO|nr:hypothetical protein C5167_001460 [Papaver somniferum]